MSLRFILGRAGSGKTHHCLAEIAARVQQAPLGSPLVFLTPDQATFQAERALAGMLPAQGFSRAQVLSFNRLAVTILGEVGGLAQPELSPLGRQMLLRALLLEYRDQLQVFNHAARQPGFVLQLESALQELTRYNHTPNDMRKIAEGLPGAVAQKKLEDLALLWQGYQKALTERMYGVDEYMHTAVTVGPQSTFLSGAEFWVDGFASFTPLEHSLLLMLVRHAQTVNLALCMEPADWAGIVSAAKALNAGGTDNLVVNVDPLGLFHRTQATCARVLMEAQATGVHVEIPLLLSDTPRFCVPELVHLEAEFARPVPTQYSGATTALRLVEAVNRKAEVEAVGRDILRLCRDEGYRFRDIAIITRDLQPYHELLQAVFGDMGIPCFIDRRASVAHHPVVELLRSGLEVISTRWELRPLLRALKTDLLPFTREEVDLLENYCLEHGLRGSAWHAGDVWQYGVRSGARNAQTQELARRLDGVRRRVADCFTPLQKVFTQRQIVVRAGCAALYAFLQQAGVPEILQAWAESSTAQGEFQDSATHQQVWDACIDLLDQMVEALGDTELGLTEFSQVLASGLENLHLGLIPPVLDQVLVGAVDRSRQPHLRAAYVLGVGEKSFPATGSEDSMFTDSERELLGNAGFELGPTTTEQALQEQYLGYIAFTRSSEYLWISYPLAGDDGRALAPSPFVARLRATFPGMHPELAGNEPEGSVEESLPWLVSSSRLVAAAVRRLQAAGSSSQRAAWQELAVLHGRNNKTARILAALHHTQAERPLAPRVAAALASEQLRSSVSRLESFASCPFQHFAQHLLHLQERQEFRVQYTDVGLLVHETMHRFVQELQRRQIDWADLVEQDANNLADRIVDDMAPRLRSEVLLSSARYQYLVNRMKRVLRLAIWVWSRHAQRGCYRPLGTEVAFGEQGMPGWDLTLPDGRSLELHGRIDRIDSCAEEGTVYLRVIDYKGSGTGFSVIDLYHGLRLQLTVYLNIALRATRADSTHGAVLPGGAYYFNVREPMIGVTKPLSPEELEKELLKKMRLNGVTLGTAEAIALAEEDGKGQLIPATLNKDGSPGKKPLTITQDQMEQLFSVAEHRMVSFSTRILTGEVNTAPFRYPNGDNACQFCRYHVVCHFDPQVPGDRYRPLEHRDNRRAWDLFPRLLAAEKPGA